VGSKREQRGEGIESAKKKRGWVELGGMEEAARRPAPPPPPPPSPPQGAHHVSFGVLCIMNILQTKKK
jgi:hypothetical protein